jgi:hypothetical protein
MKEVDERRGCRKMGQGSVRNQQKMMAELGNFRVEFYCPDWIVPTFDVLRTTSDGTLVATKIGVQARDQFYLPLEGGDFPLGMAGTSLLV